MVLTVLTPLPFRYAANSNRTFDEAEASAKIVQLDRKRKFRESGLEDFAGLRQLP